LKKRKETSKNWNWRFKETKFEV